MNDPVGYRRPGQQLTKGADKSKFISMVHQHHHHNTYIIGFAFIQYQGKGKSKHKHKL